MYINFIEIMNMKVVAMIIDHFNENGKGTRPSSHNLTIGYCV